MHPLTPYLLGQKHPQGKRVANCQKCIRTNDIDMVGDPSHLTFFEMLGNWSFGDYFKEDSITWSFEFLTEQLKLDKDKIYVTCFKGDKNSPKDIRSAEVWESLGIKKKKIYLLAIRLVSNVTQKLYCVLEFDYPSFFPPENWQFT